MRNFLKTAHLVNTLILAALVIAYPFLLHFESDWTPTVGLLCGVLGIANIALAFTISKKGWCL